MGATNSYFVSEQVLVPTSNRILVVSWGMPPSVNGSSAIVENLSHQFAPSEMSLAGQAWVGTEKYHRSPHLPRIHYLNREQTWPKRGRRYFRWLRWLTLPRITRRIVRIVQEGRFDVILGVFPDEFFFYAAYRAAKRAGIPFYPFMHNTYRENRTGIAHRFAEWLEPRVFRDSPVVFVANEGMREHYEPLYPDLRFEAIVHTFNEPIPDFASPPTPGTPLSLAFQGNLNESNIDAAKRLAEVVNRRDDYTLTTYSGTPDWFFAKVGVSGPRIKHTSVPYDQVATALRKHDILLLPHGLTGGLSQVEYDTIFPTRTVPNLLSGRPILAHSPANCTFTRWLRRHDCAEVIDQPDAAALERAIERLRTDAARRDELVRNGLAIVKMFHAPVVAGKLKRVIAETMPATASARHSSSPETSQASR
jgi:glycosyltransferase involved in cell wall biosynthesis